MGKANPTDHSYSGKVLSTEKCSNGLLKLTSLFTDELIGFEMV